MGQDPLDDIFELNLSYLVLSQRLLKADRASALYRLKLSGEIADLLISLSTKQLRTLSRCHSLLFRPVHSSPDQIRAVLQSSRNVGVAITHNALLLASERTEPVPALPGSHIGADL